jgi:hypothetical protein
LQIDGLSTSCKLMGRCALLLMLVLGLSGVGLALLWQSGLEAYRASAMSYGDFCDPKTDGAGIKRAVYQTAANRLSCEADRLSSLHSKSDIGSFWWNVRCAVGAVNPWLRCATDLAQKALFCLLPFPAFY